MPKNAEMPNTCDELAEKYKSNFQIQVKWFFSAA